MGYSREQVEKNLDAILAFADIGEFIHQPVKTYSSGMYVRLAFAVAINVEPDILIVDEALAVGDIAFQAKCYQKFKRFMDEGKTILFVTHSLDSIIRHCNRGIVLNCGQKITEAAPKEAVDVYKKLLVNCYQQDRSLAETQNTKRYSVESIFKQQFSINPNATIYGNLNAEIIDFGIFDGEDVPSLKLLNNELFSIKMKIQFHQHIEHPIFAYTIKDLKGLEITGTNTLCKFITTGSYMQKDVVFVEFSQKLNIQAGQYTLSLGCTCYENDNFVVYHRLYDILLFEVISSSQMVGFYDLGSQINIERLTN